MRTGTNTAIVVQAAEVPEVMEEVQVMGKAEGSIIKLLLAPEEGDHMEGMLQQLVQLEQLEHELMEVTMGFTSPAAEEVVERALGESLDIQEVLGASTTARAAEPETVPRQG